MFFALIALIALAIAFGFYYLICYLIWWKLFTNKFSLPVFLLGLGAYGASVAGVIVISIVWQVLNSESIEFNKFIARISNTISFSNAFPYLLIAFYLLAPFPIIYLSQIIVNWATTAISNKFNPTYHLPSK